MSNPAVSESAGEWYLGVYCRKCRAPVPVFRDRGRGAAITEGTGKLTVACPGCGKNAHYTASEVISFLVHTGPVPGTDREHAPVNDDQPAVAAAAPAPAPAVESPAAPAPQPEPQPILELEPDPTLDELASEDSETETDDEVEPVLELEPDSTLDLDAESVLELDPDAMLDDDSEPDVEDADFEEAGSSLDVAAGALPGEAEPEAAVAPEPTLLADPEPILEAPPKPELHTPVFEEPALEGPVLHGEVEPVLELEPDPALEPDPDPIVISGLVLDLTATEAEPSAAATAEPADDIAPSDQAIDEEEAEAVGESPVVETPAEIDIGEHEIAGVPVAETPLREPPPAAALDTGNPEPDAPATEAFARESLVIEPQDAEAPPGETPAIEMSASETAEPFEADGKSAVETDALLDLIAAFETTGAPPPDSEAVAAPAVEDGVAEPSVAAAPVATSATEAVLASEPAALAPRPEAEPEPAPAEPVSAAPPPVLEAPLPEAPVAEAPVAEAPVRQSVAQTPPAPKPIARVYRERWAVPANRPQVIVELRPVLRALRTRADATGHDVLMRVAEQFLDYLADVPAERQSAAAVEQYINAVFALAARGPVRGTDPVGEAMAASLRAINRHAGLYRAA